MRRFDRHPPAEPAAAASVLRLGGAIDIATAHEIEALVAAVGEREGDRTVIDLSEVTFVDCRGVALLVRARERAAASHGTLDLVGAANSVQRVIELVAPDLLSSATADPAPRLALAS